MFALYIFQFSTNSRKFVVLLLADCGVLWKIAIFVEMDPKLNFVSPIEYSSKYFILYIFVHFTHPFLHLPIFHKLIKILSLIISRL